MTATLLREPNGVESADTGCFSGWVSEEPLESSMELEDLRRSRTRLNSDDLAKLQDLRGSVAPRRASSRRGSKAPTAQFHMQFKASSQEPPVSVLRDKGGLGDLEALRLEVTAMVAKEVHTLQTRLDEDVAGLLHIIGDTGKASKRSEHFTEKQFNLLQQQHRLYGLSQILFMLHIVQLPEDGREEVTATLVEQKDKLEMELQPTLMHPIEDPLSDVMVELDRKLSGNCKHRFRQKFH